MVSEELELAVEMFTAALTLDPSTGPLRSKAAAQSSHRRPSSLSSLPIATEKPLKPSHSRHWRH